MMKNLTKKISSSLLFVLLGISLISTTSIAEVVNIPEGAIIKTTNNPDVYIVKYKNGKQFKRLVLNPQVFESYGHLRWEDILIVSQSKIDSFVTSDLVKVDGQTDIYQLVPDGDVGIKVLLEVAVGYDLDMAYTINAVDFGNYTICIRNEFVEGIECSSAFLKFVEVISEFIESGNIDYENYNEITYENLSEEEFEEKKVLIGNTLLIFKEYIETMFEFGSEGIVEDEKQGILFSNISDQTRFLVYFIKTDNQWKISSIDMFINDASMDSDHDGISDHREKYMYFKDNCSSALSDYCIPSTKFNDSDTDGDGWWDGIEKNIGTDPDNGNEYPQVL